MILRSRRLLHQRQLSELSFVSVPALIIYGFRDLVVASTARVVIAIDVPPDHPLRP